MYLQVWLALYRNERIQTEVDLAEVIKIPYTYSRFINGALILCE
jgi:hypothetical protein